jgi:hypothetical protein
MRKSMTAESSDLLRKIHQRTDEWVIAKPMASCPQCSQMTHLAVDGFGTPVATPTCRHYVGVGRVDGCLAVLFSVET